MAVPKTTEMKSTKVQTLGAVALHATCTTACTDETSIIGLSSLNWAISLMPCLGLHVVWSVQYAFAHAIASYTHALMRDHYRTSCTDVKRRVYETLQREENGGLELAWSRVSS